MSQEIRYKQIIGVFLVILLLPSMVLAHNNHDPHDLQEQVEAIINAELPCDSLTDEQLVVLGEYVMEQQHPGEAHEEMDEMMGGEDSELLEQMHINMGYAYYCSESPTGTSMMNMMYSDTGENTPLFFWMAMMPILLLISVLIIVWLIVLLRRKK